ncbi:MAG: thioesterase family protein [Rhodococcus sp. (in: high G+C Gram-positive bacteria)]|uniref:thioesterase family protein n=1 Tax=Rhodococcus sp. TaxID=1831 RepID=UPI002ADA3BA1|nr:thioesterase family protein [Rhodococcus sp. (in: high G+C Gram-positive bacteria)]MDZ7910665.1 thioesterase family protein [Rhodococcus sp. (in: high G+C Gram-positive bacteria)]
MTIRWLARMVALGRSARVGQALDTRFRVQVFDLDIQMHMTNGRYLSVLDASRISYFAKTGLWRQLRRRRWAPVVTAQTITYKRPLLPLQSYRVRTVLVGADSHNLYFEQTFHSGDTDYAMAVVSVRITDQCGQSVSPPEVLTLAASVPAELPESIAAWSTFSRNMHSQNARQSW